MCVFLSFSHGTPQAKWNIGLWNTRSRGLDACLSWWAAVSNCQVARLRLSTLFCIYPEFTGTQRAGNSQVGSTAVGEFVFRGLDAKLVNSLLSFSGDGRLRPEPQRTCYWEETGKTIISSNVCCMWSVNTHYHKQFLNWPLSKEFVIYPIFLLLIAYIFTVHCRHRKIRCRAAVDDPQGRCVDCIKLKKDCKYVPIDTQPTAKKKSRHDFNPHRRQSAGSPRVRGVVPVSCPDAGQGVPIYKPGEYCFNRAFIVNYIELLQRAGAEKGWTTIHFFHHWNIWISDWPFPRCLCRQCCLG